LTMRAPLPLKRIRCCFGINARPMRVRRSKGLQARRICVDVKFTHEKRDFPRVRNRRVNCCWSREGIVDSRRNEPSTIYIYISPHPKQTLLPFTFLLHYTVSLTLDSPQIKKDSSSPIIIRDILPDPLDSPLACFAIERISSSEKKKKKEGGRWHI